MKRFLPIAVLILLFSQPLLMGQNAEPDTILAKSVDHSLVGKDIVGLLQKGNSQATVKINQSAELKQAFHRHVSANASRPLMGYRIRVFYDNQQSARARSEAIAASIKNAYPDVRVYRTYESPNFKVSVGDFRNKAEALKVYNGLKQSYPTAFLIKEQINYPVR